MSQHNGLYTARGNQLLIEEAVITFDFPIVQVVEVSGMLIVRIEKPFRTIYNENVFGVSLAEKKVKWQIAKLKYSTGEVDCPFIDILIFEGRLRLNNWCSIFLIVDPFTGEILERSAPAKY
jgi:hypothetical protein